MIRAICNIRKRVKKNNIKPYLSRGLFSDGNVAKVGESCFSAGDIFNFAQDSVRLD